MQSGHFKLCAHTMLGHVIFTKGPVQCTFSNYITELN